MAYYRSWSKTTSFVRDVEMPNKDSDYFCVLLPNDDASLDGILYSQQINEWDYNLSGERACLSFRAFYISVRPYTFNTMFADPIAECGSPTHFVSLLPPSFRPPVRTMAPPSSYKVHDQPTRLAGATDDSWVVLSPIPCRQRAYAPVGEVLRILMITFTYGAIRLIVRHGFVSYTMTTWRLLFERYAYSYRLFLGLLTSDREKPSLQISVNCCVV